MKRSDRATEPFPHLTERIRQELRDKDRPYRLLEKVEAGDLGEALEFLMFFVRPERFAAALDDLERVLPRRMEDLGTDGRLHLLRFVADLVIALRSFLPRWVLQDRQISGENALTDAALGTAVVRLRGVLDRLQRQAPDAARELVRRIRSGTVARVEAEGGIDDFGIVSADSPGGYADRMGASIERSHLRRIAEMRARGETATEIGNDFAAHLSHALLLGASHATTNPVLIDRTWTDEPAIWDPVIDRIVREQPGASVEELAQAFTLQIVLSSMRLLRPIFLVTAGRMGYVNYQVSPRHHGSPEKMVHEAIACYGELERELKGGVPNVVFKLPATPAGLQASRELTDAGIGVTITVSFGLFQQMPFAEALRRGRSMVSYLVGMNGRLAFPIRDELLERQTEFFRLGFDEGTLRMAAAWSAVVVHKRLIRLLAKTGVDLSRVRPLVASLRIYEGLPDTPCPDLSEALGTGVITVFPNIRSRLDALPSLVLHPRSVIAPAPARVMEVLSHSELFKQAHWMPGDGALYRPSRPISLQEPEGLHEWPPFRNTLQEFVDGYGRFLKRVGGRAGSAPTGADPG
jgi:hypothetical protein